jgi:hypothetical protein
MKTENNAKAKEKSEAREKSTAKKKSKAKAHKSTKAQPQGGRDANHAARKVAIKDIVILSNRRKPIMRPSSPSRDR